MCVPDSQRVRLSQDRSREVNRRMIVVAGEVAGAKFRDEFSSGWRWYLARVVGLVDVRFWQYHQ